MTAADTPERSKGHPAVVAAWSPPADGTEFDAPALSSQDEQYHRVGSVPFIGGAAANTFATDLNALLADNTRRDNVFPEVWSDGARPDLEQKARVALQRAGYTVATTTLAQARHAREVSASAYGLQLGLLVAAGALLVAALVMAAVQIASASARMRDQGALLMSRVPSSAIDAGSRTEAFLLVGPALLGGVLGWLGACLAAPSVPWYATDPPYPVASTTPPLIQAAVALCIATGVIAVVAIRSTRTPRRLR